MYPLHKILSAHKIILFNGSYMRENTFRKTAGYDASADFEKVAAMAAHSKLLPEIFKTKFHVIL